MANYNRVILIGNLTRDPQLRYTPGGTAVTEIGLAVNRQWTDRSSNERREETTFVDITLWGRQAEVAGEYLSKGRQLFVEGRLQLDTWEDQNGQKRSKLRVIGENFQMLDSRRDGGGGGGGGGGGYRGSSAGSDRGSGSDAGSSSSPAESFYDSPAQDDDVPF